MDDGAISQYRRLRRTRFEEANMMSLNLTPLWTMLVEMSKATEHIGTCGSQKSSG